MTSLIPPCSHVVFWAFWQPRASILSVFRGLPLTAKQSALTDPPPASSLLPCCMLGILAALVFWQSLRPAAAPATGGACGRLPALTECHHRKQRRRASPAGELKCTPELPTCWHGIPIVLQDAESSKASFMNTFGVVNPKVLQLCEGCVLSLHAYLRTAWHDASFRGQSRQRGVACQALQNPSRSQRHCTRSLQRGWLARSTAPARAAKAAIK